MDAWREWLSDNPFLLRELRRWSKRGRAWKALLRCAGVPALVALGGLGVYLMVLGQVRTLSSLPIGLLLFLVVTLVHSWTRAEVCPPVVSLSDDAKAGRLDFTRLLPMDGRELMAKVGLARFAGGLLPVVAPLPVYALLTLFDGIRPMDLVVLLAYWVLRLFDPPDPTEVGAALSHGRDRELEAQGRRGTPSSAATLGPTCGVVLVFAVAGILVFRHLRGMLGSVRGMVAGVIGPELGAWLLLSLIVALARLAWEPQPFFGGSLSPGIPVLAFWILGRVLRVIIAGDRWDRAHEAESSRSPRLVRRLGTVRKGLATLGPIGFLWAPLMVSGALGRWAGSPSPSGSLAVLLIILAGPPLLLAVELGRSAGKAREEPEASLARDGVVVAFRALGRAVAIVMLAALLGGTVPWPEPPLALLALVALAVPALGFGLGLARFQQLPPPPPASDAAADGAATDSEPVGEAASGSAAAHPPPTRRTGCAVTALVFGIYAAPVAFLFLPPLPLPWHLLGACSPTYALLQLLPGLWRSPSPLPVWAGWLLPLAAGALLASLAPRPRKAARTVPDLRGEDVVERRLARLGERWDNPLFTLVMRRQGRRNSLAAALVRMSFWILACSGLLLGFILMDLAGRRRLSLPGFLLQPLRPLDLSSGAFFCLATALLVAGVVGLLAAMSFASSLGEQGTAGRTQRRLPLLLITPLPQREIVLGMLAEATVDALPVGVAALAVSVLWLLLAVGQGAPPSWLGIWLSAVAAGACLLLHGGLGVFRTWPRRRGWAWLRGSLRYVFWGAVFWGIPFTMRWLPDALADAVEVLRPVLAYWRVFPAAVALLALCLLPLSFRLALRAVRRHRDQDDLDPAQPESSPGSGPQSGAALQAR